MAISAIFCQDTWMVKLLRVGSLFLKKILATLRHSINSQVSNQWSSRNPHHLY